MPSPSPGLWDSWVYTKWEINPTSNPQPGRQWCRSVRLLTHPVQLPRQDKYAFGKLEITSREIKSVLPWSNVMEMSKGKGKFRPGRGHEGPEGESRYSSTLSLTSALDVGGWLTPRPGRFTPTKEIWYPLSGWVRNISSSPGFDPQTVQRIASRYTDWAISARHGNEQIFHSESDPKKSSALALFIVTKSGRINRRKIQMFYFARTHTLELYGSPRSMIQNSSLP